MPWKSHLLHGIVAGVLAALAGIIYQNIYQSALEANFNKIVNPGSIAGASMIGCILMASAYALLAKLHKQRFTGIVNIVIAILSFASIIGAFSLSLPLDIPNPELFPGLAVPMHFFPALSFFAIKPFFAKHETTG